MGCCHFQEPETNNILYGGSDSLCLLLYGYIRKIKGKHIIVDDIISLILEKLQLLETFIDSQERKVEREAAGFMTGECGNIFREIECFDGQGYNSGVRYLSIKFFRGDCTNHFGITNNCARMKEIKTEDRMFIIDEADIYESLQEHGVSVYFIAFNEYETKHKYSIITIKLDCDNWQVSFYRDYNKLLIIRRKYRKK
eukprot:838355_1